MISIGFLPHFQTVKTRKLDHDHDLFAFCFPLNCTGNNHYRNIYLCLFCPSDVLYETRDSVRWQSDIFIGSQDSEKREGTGLKNKSPTCDIT